VTTSASSAVASFHLTASTNSERQACLKVMSCSQSIPAADILGVLINEADLLKPFCCPAEKGFWLIFVERERERVEVFENVETLLVRK
jgi:hypothetical protein